MIHAVAVVLRGSYVSPFLLAVQLRTGHPHGHAGILLSDGRIVEASFLHNRVLVRKHPCERYNYEEVLSLSHFGLPAQQRIAQLALSMEGWKYDWRAFRSQAVHWINEEDSRRVLCFELVALASKEFLTFCKPFHLVDSADLCEVLTAGTRAALKIENVCGGVL
jgi:hypothetical protein